MRNLWKVTAQYLSLALRDGICLFRTVLAILVLMTTYFVFLRKFVLQMVANHGVYRMERELFADRLMVAGLLILIAATSGISIVRLAIEKGGVVRQGGRVSFWQVVLARWLATAILSFCYSIGFFLIFELYVSYHYGYGISGEILIKGAVILALSSLVHAGILNVIGEVVHNEPQFSSAMNLYGGLIGFLGGAYLPYFFYGGVVREGLFFLPCTQLISLMRKVCLEGMMTRLHHHMSSKELERLGQAFGISLFYREDVVSPKTQLLVIVAWMGFLFVVVGVFAKYQKRKS